MFQNKQLRWIAIATLIVSTANNMICSYNNTIMAQNGLDSKGITIALFASNIINIFVSLIMGPIADKMGRKWGTVIFGFVSAISFILFVFVSPMITDPLAGGIFAGVCMGLNVCSYINMMVLSTLMMSESCPASIRGSIIGVRSFMQVTAVFAMAAGGFLFRVMPTGVVCVILSVPFLILSSLIILFKTKETKNLNMEEIEAQFR